MSLPTAPSIPRRKLERCGLALAALLGSGCIFGQCNRPGPPPPDSCENAGVGRVEALEIGPGSELDTPFVAWADGDVVQPVFGGQGAQMLTIRIRVSGAAPPSCLAQTTVVTDETGATLSSDATAVNTYAEGSARTTQTLYIITDFPAPGSTITVTTRAGDTTAARTLYSEYIPADLSVTPEDLRPAKDLATRDGS